MPPVHIALMGMERVVADWDQLDVLLSLLPRSATGQAVTTYVSAMTGPRREGERDGPDEFHLVIVDNGRSAIAGSEFAEMLSCIRCGACLNVCPVYRQVGGHAYGWVYSGPMGAVLTPLLARRDMTRRANWRTRRACAARVGRRAPSAFRCRTCCWRSAVATPRHARPSETAAWQAWAATWSRTGTYWASLRAGTVASRLLGDRLARLPGARTWAKGRAMPRPAEVSFRDAWRRGQR